MNELKKKKSYILSVEYYSALKRNEILIYAITRNNWFKIENGVQ